MKKLNCAIVGCGVIAPTHVQSFKRIDGVDILWACDLILEKAEALAARFDIPNVASDYEQVFADSQVDIVSVCTDHASHSDIVSAALRAGKHVVCEKALTAHPDQLTKMLMAVNECPECICTGIFQHRFDRHFRYLKALVEEGVFGTMLSASVNVRCFRPDDYYHADPWRGTKEFEGGGVLINQAIHFLDSLLYVAGPVESLAARTANLTHGDSIDVEDCVAAALQFENGALGTIEATSSSKKETWSNRVAICGSEGSVTVSNGKFTTVTFLDAELEERVKSESSNLADSEVLSAAKSYYGAGHAGQIQDFVTAIRENRQPYVSLESAANTVRLVHAVYESCRRKSWVDVTR